MQPIHAQGAIQDEAVPRPVTYGTSTILRPEVQVWGPDESARILHAGSRFLTVEGVPDVTVGTVFITSSGFYRVTSLESDGMETVLGIRVPALSAVFSQIDGLDGIAAAFPPAPPASASRDPATDPLPVTDDAASAPFTTDVAPSPQVPVDEGAEGPALTAEQWARARTIGVPIFIGGPQAPHVMGDPSFDDRPDSRSHIGTPP